MRMKGHGMSTHDGVLLSVVMPVYNEAATVEQVVERVLAVPVPKELIVVDDGSTDGTTELLRRLSERYAEAEVRVLSQPRNRGKGAALRRGIQAAGGQYVVIQDADLEYDPAEIPEVIAPILDGQADVVYGSRFLVRRAARVLYFYHYLANVGLTFLSNLLTNRNMTDIETCYKAFRAEILRSLGLRSNDFAIEPEITAKVCKRHLRVYEIPISYYGRSYAEGKKVTWRDGLKAVGVLLRIRLIG